jgi:hypothetical protein
MRETRLVLTTLALYALCGILALAFYWCKI